MNILVIKQSSLGDVLHSTAALRVIKTKYPDSHITVLTNIASSGVLENNPDVDKLILLDYALIKKQWPLGVVAIYKEFRRVKNLMNSRQYDLAFDLQGLLRSVLFLYAAKAKQKFVKGNWLGLKGFRDKQLHAIEEMAQVLNVAGIDMPTKQMRLVSSALDVENASRILGSEGSLPLIVVSPFTRWQSKNWPLASFIGLADKLSQEGKYEVVVTGTEGDKTAIDVEMDNIVEPRFMNLAGVLTIGELGALMDKAALVVSGDSFPMHLASAVGTPLVTLFGPTDENKTGPLGEQAVVVRPNDCSKCDNSSCPRSCLNKVEVARVLGEVEGLLRSVP